MTNLNPEQEAALHDLAEADREWRAAKASVKKRAEAAAKEFAAKLEASEMSEVANRRAYLAHRARELGVPVSQIGRRGLDTGDRTTAYNVIALGAGVVPPASVKAAQEAATPVVELHPELSWTEGGYLQVRPDRENVAKLFPLIDLDAQVFDHNAQLQTAVFDVSQGGLMPLTPSFDETFGRHPVVALATDPTYRERILAWVGGQRLPSAA